SNLGLTLAKVGRRREAREALERAVQGFRDTHDDHGRAFAEKHLSEHRPRWRIWKRSPVTATQDPLRQEAAGGSEHPVTNAQTMRVYRGRASGRRA
ncbi:hypothetical protein ACFXKD_00225, partial [Nocardiopsis aegyptia]|uniref:hypothetical protein n=1 Tax=Nocardiopsis aegyptia TaxID=220378 RepID=UPI00366CA890